jgi:hypothetical protein
MKIDIGRPHDQLPMSLTNNVLTEANRSESRKAPVLRLQVKHWNLNLRKLYGRRKLRHLRLHTMLCGLVFLTGHLKS